MAALPPPATSATGVHFWPFDGWGILAGHSAAVEIYPRPWSHTFAREDRITDQQDAHSVAAWMRGADLDGSLTGFLDPPLAPAERQFGPD